MSGVYIVPELFSGSHVMNRLLGGWELSAISTLASGTPFKCQAASLLINYYERENHDRQRIRAFQ